MSIRERCWTSGDYLDLCRCRFCSVPEEPLPVYTPPDEAPYVECGHPRREPSSQWEYDPQQSDWRWE